MTNHKQRKQKGGINWATSSRGFGKSAPKKDAIYYKQLLKEAIESREKGRVDKTIKELAAPICKGDIPKSVVSEALAEISYGAFSWYYKTFMPEKAAKAPIPDEDDPILEDKIAGHTIQQLIQDGLVFGQDFSFYRDENGARHLKISPEGLDKLSPSTIEYINSVTDAKIEM